MKKYVLFFMIALLSLSCNGQKTEARKAETKENTAKQLEQPKGSWKVDKEFDKDGNLIRYDSIYSWSSNNKLEDLTSIEKDSLLKSFKSRFFTDFSHFEKQGFSDVFTQDSLFSKHFFNDDFFGSDFGKDFMDIDKIRQEMINRQKSFLKKYQKEFISPEEEN